MPRSSPKPRPLGVRSVYDGRRSAPTEGLSASEATVPSGHAGRRRGRRAGADAVSLPGRTRCGGVPPVQPEGHVSHAPGSGSAAPERQPVAELAPSGAGPAERPFPPGDYPVVVVGSGPGGLQVSYALRRLGIDHAVISADPGPGGMFRRWPFFQRLLSWTKPYALVERTSRAYERYDRNSLIPDDPEHRALQVGLMDGTSEFPSRPEMEANLAAFAGATGIRVRLDCRWEAAGP